MRKALLEKSEKDVVQEKFKKSKCVPVKTGFSIIKETPGKDKAPAYLFAGIAKSEKDAWKLAASALA